MQVFLVTPRRYCQTRNRRTRIHVPRDLPRRYPIGQPLFSPMRVRHTSTKALWCCATFIFVNLHTHINHGVLSKALTQESSSQLADVQAVSLLSQPTTPLGGASYGSTKSMSMEINPPTLDLRALSLNRAPAVSKTSSRLLLYRTTTPRPPSPPPIPSVKSEDEETEYLYGPPRGLPSPRASRHDPRRQRSPSLQLPAESEPRVLPVLAAKDPHVLAMLEGQELREAARPRRGMRKAQAVRGAGKKRAGFVLVEGLTDYSRWAISRK